MLSSEGPRVIDFGVARDLSTETTVTSRIFGTPAYMAPEQLQASGVGPPADIFAWASVIAYAATGKAPFNAPHMMAVVYRITTAEPDLAGVPDDLLWILQRCLDKDQDRRPSAQQVLAMLLGRPTPAHDMTDPTIVLAEATDIVHDAGPAVTLPWIPAGRRTENSPRAGSPGQTLTPPVSSAGAHAAPVPDDEPWRNAPPPRPHTGRAWGEGVIDPNRSRDPGDPRRTAVIVLVLLILLAVGLWLNGLRPFGARGENTSSGRTSTSAPETSAPVKQPVPTTDPGDDNPPATDDNTGNDDNSGPGKGGGSDNSGPGNSNDDDGLTIPEKYDGIWEGKGRQVDLSDGSISTWNARIDLEEGETSGTFALTDPDLDCSGPLTVQDVGLLSITLISVMEKDPNDQCAAGGKVTLTRIGSQLSFTWVNSTNSFDRATATLSET